MSAADVAKTLEALAELRLSLVAAARKAREAKNAPLAKDLNARAADVKDTLARLRRPSHDAWAVDARRFQIRLAGLSEDLKGIAGAPGATAMNARRAARFLAAAEGFLRWLEGGRS